MSGTKEVHNFFQNAQKISNMDDGSLGPSNCKFIFASYFFLSGKIGNVQQKSFYSLFSEN